MKLPRDLSGEGLALLLPRHGYEISRQTGSHLRPTSSSRGFAHHVTVPRRKSLKAGTLSSILNDVASYVGVGREELAQDLFGD